MLIELYNDIFDNKQHQLSSAKKHFESDADIIKPQHFVTRLPTNFGFYFFILEISLFFF